MKKIILIPLLFFHLLSSGQNIIKIKKPEKNTIIGKWIIDSVGSSTFKKQYTDASWTIEFYENKVYEETITNNHPEIGKWKIQNDSLIKQSMGDGVFARVQSNKIEKLNSNEFVYSGYEGETKIFLYFIRMK